MQGLAFRPRILNTIHRWIKVTDKRAIALMISTGAGGVIGVAFWAAAAHLYNAVAVGRASAEVSAMSLLAAFAELDVPQLFTRFLPEAGSRTGRFVWIGYVGTCALGILLAIGFVWLGFGEKILPSGGQQAVVFVVAVGLWVIFRMQDAVLVGLRAAVWVPVENVAFACAKLMLLFVFVSMGAAGIFFGWTLPVIVAILLVNAFLFGRLIPRHENRGGSTSSLPGRRQLVGLVVMESVAGHVSLIVQSLIPLIMVDRLGARTGAYFYIPWLVSTTLSALLWNISTSYVVEARFEPHRARVLLRRSVGLGLVILIPCAVVLVAGAPLVMRLFAPGYGTHATTLLRLLGVATVLGVLPQLYSTLVWREGRRFSRLAGAQTLSSVITIVGTVVLIGHFGIDAPAFALLLSGILTSAVVLGPTIRAWRSLPDTAT